MKREFDTTPEQSRIMASIRASETKPEVLLRKALWHLGVRGYRKYPKLPGKPDLLFARAKLAIFVDGCFWHGCPLHHRMPKSNPDYWPIKIERNKMRDAEVNLKLFAMGYSVLRIWEHDITANPAEAAHLIKEALDAKGS